MQVQHVKRIILRILTYWSLREIVGNIKCVILQHTWMIAILIISREISLRWMPQDLATPSQYLNQYLWTKIYVDIWRH